MSSYRTEECQKTTRRLRLRAHGPKRVAVRTKAASNAHAVAEAAKVAGKAVRGAFCHAPVELRSAEIGEQSLCDVDPARAASAGAAWPVRYGSPARTNSRHPASPPASRGESVALALVPGAGQLGLPG
jgi:hypothetical protein